MSHRCHAYFWMLKLCGCAGINCRAIHFHATALAAAAVAGSTIFKGCLFICPKKTQKTTTHTHIGRNFLNISMSSFDFCTTLQTHSLKRNINKQKQPKTKPRDIIICYKTEQLFNSQTEEKITVCLSSRLLYLLCCNIHLCSFVSHHGLFNCVNTELQLIDVAPHDRVLSPYIIYHVLYILRLLWILTDVDRNCTSW